MDLSPLLVYHSFHNFCSINYKERNKIVKNAPQFQMCYGLTQGLKCWYWFFLFTFFKIQDGRISVNQISVNRLTWKVSKLKTQFQCLDPCFHGLGQTKCLISIASYLQINFYCHFGPLQFFVFPEEKAPPSQKCYANQAFYFGMKLKCLPNPRWPLPSIIKHR